MDSIFVAILGNDCKRITSINIDVDYANQENFKITARDYVGLLLH